MNKVKAVVADFGFSLGTLAFITLAVVALNLLVGCAEADSEISITKPVQIIEQPAPPAPECPQVDEAAKLAEQYIRCTEVCRLRFHRRSICQFIVYGN